LLFLFDDAGSARRCLGRTGRWRRAGTALLIRAPRIAHREGGL